MSIRINWTNPNAIFDEIRIYRTVAPIDYTNIPTSPLATLTTGLTYLDTTALADTYYYYTIAVVKGTDVILNPSTLTYQLLNSGPGPKVVQCGDMKLGYFGTVPTAELFTAAEISATLSGMTSLQTRTFTWAKFIRDGKIIYVPTDWLGRITWRDCYHGGAVYGTDDNGLTPSGYTPTNQRKIISKGSDDFILRLPRYGSNPDRTWATPGLDVNSELSQLFLSVSLKAFTTPGQSNLGDSITTWYSATSGTMCMEWIATNISFITTAGLPGTTYTMGFTTSMDHRPVLELVR